MQNVQSMDYKYSHYVIVPQKLQLFVDATKITNFWSQQHNLFYRHKHCRKKACHSLLYSLLVAVQMMAVQILWELHTLLWW